MAHLFLCLRSLHKRFSANSNVIKTPLCLIRPRIRRLSLQRCARDGIEKLLISRVQDSLFKLWKSHVQHHRLDRGRSKGNKITPKHLVIAVDQSRKIKTKRTSSFQQPLLLPLQAGNLIPQCRDRILQAPNLARKLAVLTLQFTITLTQINDPLGERIQRLRKTEFGLFHITATKHTRSEERRVGKERRTRWS